MRKRDSNKIIIWAVIAIIVAAILYFVFLKNVYYSPSVIPAGSHYAGVVSSLCGQSCTEANLGDFMQCDPDGPGGFLGQTCWVCGKHSNGIVAWTSLGVSSCSGGRLPESIAH